MVIATHTTVEVSVSRFRLCLVKVEFPNGHHIVIGGRLVSSSENGVVTPHPDLPAYEMSDFPVDFNKWADGDVPAVSVTMLRGATRKKIGCVRACTLLFNQRDERAVRDWIRGQR